MNSAKLFSNKKVIYSLLGVGIVILTGLNFWGWFFIRSFTTDILAQLKQHLRVTGEIYAEQLSEKIVGETFLLQDIFSAGANEWNVITLHTLLYDFKQRSQLEDIFVVSLDRRQFIGYELTEPAANRLEKFLFNDSLFLQATLGNSPEPELNRLADQYFLTAYTPIRDENGDVAAVLITEAPAQLFSNLRFFEHTLLYVALGALGMIILFAVLIILAVRQLFAVETRLHQQTRLAHLGQMAAMVAHEIRNPLSIIKGSADVLRRKYSSEENELFDFIPEEIDRLNRLVNEFLQFARQKEPNLQPTNPAEVITPLVDQLNDERISAHFEPSLPKVQLDRDAFKQIILNILENARQATGDQGNILVRGYTVSQRSLRCVIEVKDDGVGMPRETLEKIFDPFFSTRATGSGLGMAITKQLVEQMNGQISVESQPNQGTTVKLIFPV